jgi:hypothetical protein
MPQCKRIKSDGERCRQNMPSGAEHCLWHDPERKAEAAQLRHAGGKKGGGRRTLPIRTVQEEEVPGPPRTAEDATRLASWVSWAVLTGKIDPKTAHTAAYSIRSFLAALEKSELDVRIRELRAELEVVKKRGGMRGVS